MKVLMTGGGTGGHIYPALALIDYIKQVDPSCEFMYVGAKRGLESKILPEMGLSYELLTVQGLKRSLSMDNVKTINLFLKGVSRGKKIIKEFQPDIVVGTGGYVSAAMVYAAHKCHVPTMIHEQNSVPGITNKFLARFVKKVAISFPDVAQYFPKEKVVLTGNPRASQVIQGAKSDILTTFGLSPEKKTVLIFGGSQGAKKINDGVLEALEDFSKKEYQVLYASGERFFATFKDKTWGKNIAIVPYIKNMNEILGNVDLLVGRAGATSIAEFTALGLPAILVPSPYVTNDHQTKNAQSLVKVGAAVMIKDSEFSGETLVKECDTLFLQPETLENMAQKSKSQGYPNAAKDLYNIMLSLIK